MNSTHKKATHGLRSIVRRKVFKKIKVMNNRKTAVIRICGEAVAVTEFDQKRGTVFAGRYRGKIILLHDFQLEEITDAQFKTYREFDIPLISPNELNDFILDRFIDKRKLKVRLFEYEYNL